MKPKGLLSLIALGVLGVLCLYLGWQWRTAQTALVQRQNGHDSEVRGLLAEHERLKNEVANLQADLDKAKQWPFVACSDLGIANMKAQGLQNPIADVIADLETQTDLVPFQPIGGGQTRIGTWLINCGWVLAVAEDGHKGILAILDYEIDKGQIKWSVRAAQSDPAVTTTR
jgi:hypothetical protein